MTRDYLDVLHAGSVAPDFTLPDQDGVKHTLSKYRGQWVVLCFYGEDDIAGCAREIEVLVHHFEAFKKLGIILLGISTDSVKNHKQFAEKHHIPFPLLSDCDRKVAKKYELMVSELSSVDHENIPQISFLVNIVGEIEKIYHHVTPERHASELIADFMKLQKEGQGSGGM